jgi:hypothetical protein
MTDEHSEKVVRLLDIIYDLYGADSNYPYQNLPFSVSDDGAVTLGDGLIAELNKNGNNDLIEWAHENIVSLFK